MPNTPRFVKTFSVTSRRLYRKDQPVKTERPDVGIDELVNAWVKETGNIILNATPTRHTIMEKAPDGTLIRKTVQLLAVIYQTEDVFLEAESELRRRALVPLARKEDLDKPMPISEDEEHRQAERVSPSEVSDANAGGPDGHEQFMIADDDDEEF